MVTLIKRINSRFIKTMAFNSLKVVEIDPEGRFKYILIRATVDATKEEKMLVRGFRWANYHADIFEDVENKLKGSGVSVWCTGGGRIIHSPAEKTIKVFGYSQGYGKGDHALASELLRKEYPGYDVSWSDEGY